MEQEKVFISINKKEADFLVENLEPKGFQVNKVGTNGRYYVAIHKVGDNSSLLTLSALVLELFKKRILTDALCENGVDSDEILEIIENEKAWELLSEDSISKLYSDIYKDLISNQIIDVGFTAAKHFANRRKSLSKEVKERLESIN